METQTTRILVVDDDEMILVAITETLAHEGFEIVTENNPLEALQRLREGTFAAILSDQRMAEMTGLAFLGEAKKIQPNASRILITGVLTLKTVIAAINQGEIYRFIAKPWIREELIATVQNAVQRFQLIELNLKLQDDTLRLNDQLASANHQLESRIQEIVLQKKELQEAHHSLARNFDRSLEMCLQLVTTFHPLLGRETRSIVEIAKLMIAHGTIAESDARVLQVAAWIQNLGLLGISRELLLKARKNPERLTSPEKELIHHHPIYSETVAHFFGQLKEVGPAVRAHHERWNGSGYPDGLAGESIPLPARYLAVAVHYVECGRPREQAIEEIIQGAGRAFDPEAVRLFSAVTRNHDLPRKVKEIVFSELALGMTLARGIHSPAGLLLIPEGHRLNETTLRKLREHNQADPTSDRVLVYV